MPPVTTAAPPRATWKTITIGNAASTGEISLSLEAEGFAVSAWASEIMGVIPLVTFKTTIDLVLVSAAQLRCTRENSIRAIYRHASALGFECVPSEVGPQLRLQYSDQPPTEAIAIGMEPIPDLSGRLNVFTVTHRVIHSVGRRWLDTYCLANRNWRPADFCWVFSRGRAR